MAENTDSGLGQRSMKKLTMHARISAVIFVVGLALMVRQMYADSEPGAIPLLLVAIGLGWYIITLVRLRSHRKERGASAGKS
jgi:hypothetical protein